MSLPSSFTFSFKEYILTERIFCTLIEPCLGKTCLQGFRPGMTKTGLYGHRRWLETLNFRLRREIYFTACKAKTKVQMSCTTTGLHLCFRLCKSRFSRDVV